MSTNKIRSLSIQWHITDRCGNRCRHCYMYEESTYDAGHKKEKDLAGLLEILDSIGAFEDQWQACISGFAITGGDPLLHPQWAALMRELQARGKSASMMGNPETLTPENLALLGDLGIQSFQLSLDGLESRHDYFRSKGSFGRTVEGLQRLKDAGIRSNVMFTLYPENQDDLIPLLTFVATQTAADRFSFDIGTCAGNAESLQKGLGPDTVKALVSAYLAEKERLRNAGNPIRIAEKNSFLKLIRFEQSRLFPFSSDEVPVVSGCLIGWNCVPILTDGTVLACRRFPLQLGKLPEQSFEEIFLGSEELKKFRRRQFFQGCRECDFYQHCRGCPAVVHGLSGDPFAPNPLCFRKSLTKSAPRAPEAPPDPPLDTTLQQERDLVASHFSNVVVARAQKWLKEDRVQQALFWLSQGDQQMRPFLAAPDAYLDERGLELSGLERLFVLRFLEGHPRDDPKHADFYRRLFVAHFRS